MLIGINVHWKQVLLMHDYNNYLSVSLDTKAESVFMSLDTKVEPVFMRLDTKAEPVFMMVTLHLEACQERLVSGSEPT